MNILVAEDYRASRETIKFLMDDWGYKSDIVFNGREAVEKTRKRGPDKGIFGQGLDLTVQPFLFVK